MTTATDIVISEIYDHLLEHPFFNDSVRKFLGISKNTDVSDNTLYWETKTKLIDETLVALISLNKSGSQLS